MTPLSRSHALAPKITKPMSLRPAPTCPQPVQSPLALDRIVRAPGRATLASKEAHGLGFGVLASAGADIGLVLGAAATGSVGAGVFSGPRSGMHPGAFASGGSFAGVGTHALRAPQSQVPVAAVGAFAGAGLGVFVTNATSVAQLRGVAQTFSADVGVGPLKFSAQVAESKGIVIGSISIGPGIGLDASAYPTQTIAKSR